ncbi:MAG: hypothetical protein GX421_02105 [Caldisericales bacterium]|nr:hypothetical protein [Caldisericales bacterium]
MKVIRARAGLPSWLSWALSLVLPVTLFWLPESIIQPFLRITIAIASFCIIFPITTMLPRKRLLLAFDDCTIETSKKSVRVPQVSLVRLNDCGRISGLRMDFFLSGQPKQAFSIWIDSVHSGETFIEEAKKLAPLSVATRSRQKFGLPQEWIVSAILAALTVGIANYFLGLG